MKNLPIGIQTFDKLITEGYLYIDKTREIHRLLVGGGQYYFISRPRRFGKSLLISTLSEIFSGNKDLFKGLWIYDQIDWAEYPVISIDFSSLDYDTDELLKQTLLEFLTRTGRAHNIGLTEPTYKTRFAELIEKLAVKGKVVILIDEYDKPIIDKIHDPQAAYKNREVLRQFYSIIKSADRYIKFVFLTGVSKFSKVSVFSGLNNLEDITLSGRYGALLGYTHEELLHYFADYLDVLAATGKMGREALVEKIRTWYNGYSWDGRNFLYNPFSILRLFKEQKFANYWFSTGTPFFLINLIKKTDKDITQFDRFELQAHTVDHFDIERIEVVPLLFQTGYLTIKEIAAENDSEMLRLDYPNKEVRDSFMTYLFRSFVEKDGDVSDDYVSRTRRALNAGDIGIMMQEMKSLFASIPYNIFKGREEAYYQTVIYLLLNLAGASVLAEQQTNLGRIDAVFETDEKIVIMEFKMGSETEALQQIKTKKYAEKYLARGKPIVLVGVGIDKAGRNIGAFIIEQVR